MADIATVPPTGRRVAPGRNAGFATGRKLRYTDPRYLELLGFAWDEAATLDHNDLDGWLDLLTADVTYVMPVRVTRRRGAGSEIHPEMVHLDEDHASLAFRIRRLTTTKAWSEDPPSRTRRFVTGVMAYETDEPDEFDVASSLLLMRNQDDDYRVDIVTAEREDRVRFVGGEPRLARRLVLCDQATIGTPNLAVFL
jgi:phthalate 3,4-dioxygenase beta subunit